MQTVFVFVIMLLIFGRIAYGIYKVLKGQCSAADSACASCSADCKMKEFVRKGEKQKKKKRIFF